MTHQKFTIRGTTYTYVRFRSAEERESGVLGYLYTPRELAYVVMRQPAMDGQLTKSAHLIDDWEPATQEAPTSDAIKVRLVGLLSGQNVGPELPGVPDDQLRQRLVDLLKPGKTNIAGQKAKTRAELPNLPTPPVPVHTIGEMAESPVTGNGTDLETAIRDALTKLFVEGTDESTDKKRARRNRSKTNVRETQVAAKKKPGRPKGSKTKK